MLSSRKPKMTFNMMFWFYIIANATLSGLRAPGVRPGRRMSAGEPRQFGVKVKDDYYVCHIGDSEARSFNVSTDQLQSHRVKPGSPYAEKVGAVMGGLEGTSPPAGDVDDSKLVAVPDDAAAAEEPVE